ncbi:MAG: nitrile hydratase subunit beta [Pseudomonadota bacterium]
MDGVHDLAGVQGYGRVDHTVNKPIGRPFKHDWEAIGYGAIFAGVEKGLFSVDEVRHAVERLAPVHYLTTSYYDRYVIGVASLMVEKGAMTKEELERESNGPFPLAMPALSDGRPARDTTPDFKVGDRVRVRDEHFAGHCRYPAYCRGKTGTITHITSEKWPFPDSIGHGRDDAGAERTVHVEFSGTDLWDDAEAASVVVDLFEGYLEAV